MYICLLVANGERQRDSEPETENWNLGTPSKPSQLLTDRNKLLSDSVPSMPVVKETHFFVPNWRPFFRYMDSHY